MKNYNIEVTGQYSNILTLLTVNKNMRNMTVEEFIQFMKDAVAAAQAEYSEIMVEFNKKREKIFREDYAKLTWKKWDAKLKSYKRESARQAKIAEIQKEIDEYEYSPRYDSIFFDIMPMLNVGGLMHSYSCINTETSDKNYSSNYNDYLTYIKMADGVVFKYEITGTDPIKPYSFRPWIEFIIPEEIMKKLNDDHEESNKRVQKFYDSLKYKGD